MACELCGIVKAFYVERREYGFLDRSRESVALVTQPAVGKGESGIQEVDSEWVVGGGDCETGGGGRASGVYDPVEDCFGVGGGGGVGYGGFAFPAGALGCAVCGFGVEEG